MTWTQRPLARLLAPRDPASFSRDVFARKPLYLPSPEGPARFESLFDWNSLSALLNLWPENGPSLRIFKDKRNFFFKKAPESLKHLLHELRQGGTLILEDIERQDARLAAFTAALSDEIAAPARVNLYLSCPGQEGYPVHYDTHDFLILQIQGRKRWQVYPATIPSPQVQPPQYLAPGESLAAGFLPPPESSRLLEVELSPGDVLYVPKGFWHKAMAQGGPSLHLTLGLYVRTGLDLLSWLLAELRELPAFRREFPLIAKSDLPATATAASPYASHFAGLQAELAAILADPTLLWRFHQQSYAGLARRDGFSLPQQLAATAADLSAARSFSLRPLPHYLSQSPDGSLELVYPKEKLRFAPAAEPLLRFLFAQPGFSRAELCARFPELSWQELLEVILPLVQDGILVPNAEPDGRA